MARPTKQGLDYFPTWKPQKGSLSRFQQSLKIRYKALRNSSSAFIKRSDVREIILKKFDHKCIECGGDEDLQIDHINSVYLAAVGKIEISSLNSYNNLQVLCKKCNCKKSPN